ncbi:uncharacterized protein LOC117579915 isoform X1 [Drosophila guanche]|uniref:DUF4806 domain-containing protein n=1 Tax=Drosophila guanche TaxID=7266 RepID=A0A3B0JTL5_DROGU|nr:uncharacterized protein LOC117579915 isoform X1 [Drosophila guanche]SPP77039.1 Hypothetical predicted protein [Drosophila guanche]
MPPKRKSRNSACPGKRGKPNAYHNWDSYAEEDSSGSDFERVMIGKRPRNTSAWEQSTSVLKEQISAGSEQHNLTETPPTAATDFDSGVGQLLSLNNILYNNVLKEILDRLKNIQKTQAAMEAWQKDRGEEICARLEKIESDLEALQRDPHRKTGAVTSDAITNSGHWPTKVIPLNPFTLGSELEELEKKLLDEETLKLMVREFEKLTATNYDKYVRMCWRKVFVDELAEKYCWRGTTTKKCIRPLCVTLAIRSASRAKYPEYDDAIFDRSSQKFFQYAHDRIIKQANYEPRAKKVNQDDPLAISNP